MREKRSVNFKIAGGKNEGGIVFGNTYDKYGSTNPVVRWMMKGFDGALTHFVHQAAPRTIHEIGCGEGFWVNKWNQQGMLARGCDFSSEVIDIAKKNAYSSGVSQAAFSVRSIYDLSYPKDTADLVVCCEVLEHLEKPYDGMQKLQEITSNYLLMSVPREPIWCMLNMARGKYLSDFGNTPGHLQHWSRRSFIRFAESYFDIVAIASPFPWTMLLCRKKVK